MDSAALWTTAIQCKAVPTQNLDNERPLSTLTTAPATVIKGAIAIKTKRYAATACLYGD